MCKVELGCEEEEEVEGGGCPPHCVWNGPQGIQFCLCVVVIVIVIVIVIVFVFVFLFVFACVFVVVIVITE